MTVYLVGAGPGDPELLTVRAARLLSQADVVIHDRLVGDDILSLVRTDAICIDVGKVPGQPQKQHEINELLVANGRLYDTVVRLKGGDPFVFGRGGEEAQALAPAGIACELVPGITSAVAVPAIAGVPVTHRGVATSFTVVTGHRKAGEDDVNWRALAQTNGTIVILMGVSRRAEIAAELLAGGRSSDEPVAVISKGTQRGEYVAGTTLGQLGSVDIEPPSVIVVGPVAELDLFGRFCSEQKSSPVPAG
jgi:uroporphyrin-III C-methyltransferase